MNENIAQRNIVASAISNIFSEFKYLDEFHFETGSRLNYYTFVGLLNGDQSENKRMLRGINDTLAPVDQIKYGYDVFYRRKVYSNLEYRCPNAERLIDRVFQIPSHSKITDLEINEIYERLLKLGM